ncbi:unnamed protein product [Jaminaea pallidilutea]
MASATAWRRGNEAPMQWEFTQGGSGQRNAFSGGSNEPRGDGEANDAAMETSFQDESMRDVSMAADDAAVEEEEGEQRSGPSSAPEPALQGGLVPPSTPSRQARNRKPAGSKRASSPMRRSRSRSASSASSSSSIVSIKGSADQHQQQQQQRMALSRRGQGSNDPSVVQQWPLAPMVGTVINYLVPPVTHNSVPTQGSHRASLQHDHQQQSGARGMSTQAQKAHATLHPREKPLLLLNYAQLTFNASILFIALYIVFALVWTIRLDVVERLREIEDAYHHSIKTCQTSFQLNCVSSHPLPPALHAPCADWERCAQRKLTDVLGGSRLRVVIEVLSEAWEAGVAGLGWRTLAFSLLLLSVLVGGFNGLLSGWRRGVANNGSERQGGSRSRSSRRRRAHDETDSEEDGEGGERWDGSRRRIGQQPGQHLHQQAPLALPYPTSPGYSFAPHQMHPAAYQYQDQQHHHLAAAPLSPGAQQGYPTMSMGASLPPGTPTTSTARQSHATASNRSPSASPKQAQRSRFGGLFSRNSTSSSTRKRNSVKGKSGAASGRGGGAVGSGAQVVDEWVDDE